MRYLVTLLGLLGVFLVGCQSGDDSVSNSDQRDASTATIASGSELYALYCASCHGADGGGQYPDDPYSPDASGRVGAPPHNENGHTWHHPDAVLVEIVLEGRAMPGVQPMPPFAGQLSEAQIMAILDYIKTWWLPEQIASQATVNAGFTPVAP